MLTESEKINAHVDYFFFVSFVFLFAAIFSFASFVINFNVQLSVIINLL